MTSAIPQIYKELEKCVQGLEDDVKRSLEQISDKNILDEKVASVEKTKDYHYNEILNHLKQIKDHVRIISDHNKSVELLEKRVSTTVDKDYIKRQVETFQKFEAVNRREHKPIRPRETSSMKLLQCWERMLDEQGTNNDTDGIFAVRRRANSLRKTRKIVSSTVGAFLETSSEKYASLGSLLEEDSKSVEEAQENRETDGKLGKSVSLGSLIERKSRKKNKEVGIKQLVEDVSLHESRSPSSDEAEDQEVTDSKPRIVDVVCSMGVVGSKSPLERRNTVLRRSQRKSIHGVKSKADKLAKEIKKFKGTEEDTAYIELKAKIETAERDLKSHAKNLQLQTRHIYNETLKKTEQCYKLLEDKLKENVEKEKEKQEKEREKQEKEETKVTEEKVEDDDDVFIEEVQDEEHKLEVSPVQRKTVELQVIQVESIEASPQINKRFSAMKIGVPVMPGSMMESLHRKTMNLNGKAEERIAEIRKKIEKLEVEISQFVGRKNGKYYKKIKGQLDAHKHDLESISVPDEIVGEQVKLCANYISSCLSFLNEKSVDDGDGSSDDDDDFEEIMTNATEPKSAEVDHNLSPRSMRTTYI